MAHSVVKVTDIRDEVDNVDNSLLLLVGEDGMVTPDQETVESFLKHQSGPTNIQVMKFLKTEEQSIDITVDNLTYVPDVANEEVVGDESANMDEIARNLYNFRLDHDYTPFTTLNSQSLSLEDDELAKTLSMLDGPEEIVLPSESATVSPLKKSKLPPKIKLIQSITITPPNKNSKQVIGTIPSLKAQEAVGEQSRNIDEDEKKSEIAENDQSINDDNKTATKPKEVKTNVTGGMSGKPLETVDDEFSQMQVTTKAKAKFIKTTTPRSKSQRARTKTKPRVKEIVEEESDEVDYSDEDHLDFELVDDENDSDFHLEEELKGKQHSKRQRLKSESRQPSKGFLRKNKSKERKEEPNKEGVKEESLLESKEEVTLKEKTVEKTDEKQERQPETSETKQQEKKTAKKDKKVPKPIHDDFLLFSTPDIIRRVGGKEPSTLESVTPTKPAKILPQAISQRKSLDQTQSPIKTRVSLDGKNVEEKIDSKNRRSSLGDDIKNKDRRLSTTNESKSKRISLDERTAKTVETRSERRPGDGKKPERAPAKSSVNVAENVDVPSADYIRSIIMNEDTKTYTMGTDLGQSTNMETESQLNLDASGLDLDPTLLDNLNNDEISEDILYQVAKSLVSNPELQNAIDKGINDGVLDPSMAVQHNVASNQSIHVDPPQEKLLQGGTQIVRPDGRIVVIPPIERPTTRSRNKKKEEIKPTHIAVHKPLDSEHVSGNELDSSADEGEEEEESEDDPNKLWCICNQPHNNRFMICCDTCEEWYHGKCVNITKSMGQQMEAEGKEWICLFCRDPLLERPQAAARRVRKASRNSRASSDSIGSGSKKAESAASVPCVVCQKLSRKNSIYCSEACILAHAQGIERVIVFERSTGKMLTDNKAPSAANLDQWLKEHPGYEVVRSGGRIVTAKAGNLTQSKLKLVRNVHDEGVSLAVQKKGGVSVGVLKHAPKGGGASSPKSKPATPSKQSLKGVVTSIRKAGPEAKIKMVPVEPLKSGMIVATAATAAPTVSTPKQPKLVQTTIVRTPPAIAGVDKKKTPNKKREESVKRKDEPSPKPQENIRENVQKTVFEQLTNRLRECVDLKLTEEEVKSISCEIETQLHKCFGDTGQKYRNKYRSLIFNIKDPKNQTLWRRICEKSVNPYELVRLSPDDLASQELASWREKEAKHTLDMIKKSELELLNCNRQYVLKTHKGEQVVEDDRVDKIDNTEMIKSLTEGSALDSGENRSDGDKDKKKHGSHKDRKSGKEKGSSSSKDKDRERERSRKRSKSRDRKYGGEHKKHSRSKERSRDRQHRKSSHKHKKDLISSTDKLDKKSKEILEQLVDNKIVPPLEDRLWKHVPQEDILPAIESDSDHEPSSTVTIPTPPRVPDSSDEFVGGGRTPEIEKTVQSVSADDENDKEVRETSVKSTSPPPRKKPPPEIWSGAVNMIDVAQISITAHEVSGDCSGLGRELSSNLDIVGRISPDTVWEYISKMKCSNSKGISLIRLNATNVEEKMPYLALYSYLSSRDRLGVVKSLNKAVKDFYIYPLAPQKPIPQVLLPISGPGFEESRPALLLGIIVRDKRKRPSYAPDPSALSIKKAKTEASVLKPASPAAAAVVVVPPRSYTPPPVKDPRLKQPPKVEPSPPDEGDEPYSPGDSDLEAPTVVVPKAKPGSSSVKESPASDGVVVVPPYPMPGLSTGTIPSSSLEIQRQMEELNKKIEMQKSEITSMTQNMASVASTSKDIGPTSLANIALPSNLQQILDSIKTIEDGTEPPTNAGPVQASSDLTIPLMIPKNFSRPLNMSVPPPPLGVIIPELASPDTIPLNLPGKPPKARPLIAFAQEERAGVLSSLSEEQLIQKANEMLQEQEEESKKRPPPEAPASTMKRSRNVVNLPPVPGLEDDSI